MPGGPEIVNSNAPGPARHGEFKRTASAYTKTDIPWLRKEAMVVKFTLKFVEAASGSDNTRVASGLFRKPSTANRAMSAGKIRLVSRFPTTKSPVKFVRPAGNVK